MSHRKRSRDLAPWVVLGALTGLLWAVQYRAENSGHDDRPRPVPSFMSGHPDLGHGGN